MTGGAERRLAGFAAAPEAPLAEFEAEAGRHPVFELLPGGR